MSDRGMKKWLPYKSLEEQSDFLAEMRYEKNKIDKPILLADEKERINAILTSNLQNPIVLKYYEDGYIHEEKGTVTRIDEWSKTIFINDEAIPLSAIVDIEATDSFDFD